MQPEIKFYIQYRKRNRQQKQVQTQKKKHKRKHNQRLQFYPHVLLQELGKIINA